GPGGGENERGHYSATAANHRRPRAAQVRAAEKAVRPMSEWFRIFGTNDVQPEPAALLEYLHGLGMEVEGHFHGDEKGWFQADLIVPDGRAVLKLERFLAKEEGIRAELNT